jgi:hypothetical protein
MKQIEAALGIRYQLPGGAHYQDVCPLCRRKNLALVQDGLWRAARRSEREAVKGEERAESISPGAARGS